MEITLEDMLLDNEPEISDSEEDPVLVEKSSSDEDEPFIEEDIPLSTGSLNVDGLDDAVILDEYFTRLTHPVLTFIYDTCLQLYSVAEFVWQSPRVRLFAEQSTSEALQTLGNFFHQEQFINAILTSSTLREKISASFRANILIYAGMVILLEGWFKPTLRWMFPSLENSSLEKTYDYPIQAIIIAICIATNIKNSLINACIIDELQKFSPAKHAPAITDPLFDQKRADVESMIFYIQSLGVIYTDSYWKNGWSYMLASIANGQCLEEFNLACIGTQNRAKILTANNIYMLLTGMIYMQVTHCLTAILSRVALGLENPHLELAAAGFIFQLFVMMSILQKNPLPGKKEGFDFFEARRNDITKKLTMVTDWLKVQLFDTESRTILKRFLFAIPTFPPLKLVSAFVLAVGFFPHKIYQNPRLAFSRELFSIESLMDVPEFREYVLLQANALRKGDNLLPYLRFISLPLALCLTVATAAPMSMTRQVLQSLANMENNPIRKQLRFLLETAESKTRKKPTEFTGYAKVNLFARPQLTRSASTDSLAQKENQNDQWVVLKKSVSHPSLYKLRTFDCPAQSVIQEQKKENRERLLIKSGK